MEYLLILAADALLAACFAFQKKYQSISGTSAGATLTFNAFVGLFTCIIFTALGFFGVFPIEFSLFSAFMALIVTALCLSYMIIGFKLLRSGNMPFYTMFLMTGGMLVPYVFGLFFLNEEFSYLRLSGIVLIVAAVIISNTGRLKLSGSQIGMCCAVFLLNGCVSVVSKLHQAEIVSHFNPVNTESFVILMAIVKIVLCFPIAFVLMKKAGQSIAGKGFSGVLPLFVLTAVADGASCYLQLLGAKSIDAGVLYPLVTAGSIILSALLGMIAFRERPSKNQWLAMGVCLVGTCMFI